MRILVLGTSNSILKEGWVAGLQRALPDADIVNMSIGDSPGIQFGFYLDMDFTAYDVVFFDSVVNDENMLPAIGDVALLRRVTYEIITTIAAQTAVIILGFSNERNLGNHSAPYIQRKKLAAICGVQFVGMHDLVEAFGTRILPNSLTLFDPSGTHPLLPLQNLFGFELGRLLRTAAPVARSGTPVPSFAHHFRAEQVADLVPPGDIVIKSNSLMTRAHVELGAPATLTFRKAGICLGFYADIMATQAVISMKGPDGERIKEVWYRVMPDKFQVKFVPIRNGYPMYEMTMIAEGWTPPPGVEIERSSGTGFPLRFPLRQAEDPMMLSFGGALFWSGEVQAPLPEPALAIAESLELHRRLSAAINRRLLRQNAA